MSPRAPEFCADEPHEAHAHSNDHFALIYEGRNDQFASVVPFIRQGIERGERCLYVADDNSREDVLHAIREAGIDADSLLESGALAILTPGDTYRRDGAFDRTAMLEFWEETLEQATESSGYTGIRAAAEMTWALDGETSTDDLVDYEAMLNSLYEGEDYVVMCQYNQGRFPAEVIRDVIKTHPYIVADNTVSENFFYTPPAKYFGGEAPETKVDRMIRTLQDRTRVKTELEERQEYLERIFDSSHDAIFIIDPAANEIVDANPAATDMLGYTYEELLNLTPADIHPADLDAFRNFVEDVFEQGTGWIDELVCRTKHRGDIPAEISASRMELHGRSHMLAVVRDISERRKWERAQRNLYEITSDPDRTFEEKLQSLLDLGCDRFDMELGGIAIAEPSTDRFEVEVTNGSHDCLVPGTRYPLSETYCHVPATEGDTRGITDPVGEGFEDKLCYEQFGVRAYLGMYLEFEDDPNRTFWFVSSEPREHGFTGAEHTFQHLMGQWVQYELERQQRERELRERTEHLSALVDTAPECIKTVAPDGTLLQMNAAGLEMVGADAAADVTGGCVYDLIAAEDRERFRAFHERICQGERGTLTFDIIGLEGTRRHMETHAAPLHRPDGSVAHVALTRDITEQVEREHELERVLDLLEKTEQVADVGGWEIDPETKDVFWSEHLFELLEVDSEEEPPLDEALGMYHEEDRPIVEQAIQDAFDAGEPFDIEVRLRTAVTNEVRWLRLQGVPEIDGGEIVSLRGAAQDITERKARERRLEEVIEQLEASNERLEQFAYAASHDLQEPLRMVSSYLQLFERRYGDELDGDAEEFLEFAVNGADRMRDMIEGLLAYSRVETQGQPLEPVDLDAVLEDVFADLRVQIQETDADITADELPVVEGDRTQLRQVFQNLLENAITYSGDEAPQVHISAESTGSQWEVSVRDEGIGIDAEAQDRIFEVFKRLHSHEDYPGTGIGLALCERIADRHGGGIRVESEPGEGSTFTVTLPTA